MQSILGELLLWSSNYFCGHWTTVVVIELLAWLFNCYVVSELIVFSKLCTQNTSNKKKIFFLKYLCFHLSVHTWLGWQWEYILRYFSEKLIPICWVMGLLLTKGLHIKWNDKDFQTFKIEITEGHRRLILNIVTKIRNLKLKSITAWRGWRKSRKVVLMQEEIFLLHFTEAHSTKTSHHPPEPSTKFLQCSTNWAMKTHT